MGQFYPRWVKMKDGSKQLVNDPDEHAALKDTATGETAKALAGEGETPPPEHTADTADDPVPPVVTSDDVKRDKEHAQDEKAREERFKLGARKK